PGGAARGRRWRPRDDRDAGPEGNEAEREAAGARAPGRSHGPLDLAYEPVASSGWLEAAGSACGDTAVANCAARMRVSARGSASGFTPSASSTDSTPVRRGPWNIGAASAACDRAS